MTSDELTQLRSLGMIEPLPPRGTLKPLRFREHALWAVVSAVDVAESWSG
jgi:hypothetical protein